MEVTAFDIREYSLYQPDVFDYFKKGKAIERGKKHISAEQFFRTAIAIASRQISEKFDCDIKLSPARLEDARIKWMRDLTRLDIDRSAQPDVFKHVGFLVYWLRRRMFVTKISVRQIQENKEQKFFYSHGNEICSFLIGFRLALYFNVSSAFADQQLTESLQRCDLSGQYLNDVAVLLKDKNVSPHALYLVYLALFTDVYRPRKRNVARLVV